MFCAIKISKSDPTPLYIQLANELIRLIDAGILPARTKLPTIRLLASKLKINRDTVVNAYKLLESKNYVIAHMGSGTYVAPQPNIGTKKDCPPIATSKTYFNRDLFSIDMCKNIMLNILDNEGWDSFIDPLNRERNLIRISICNFLKTAGVSGTVSNTRLIKNIPNFLLELIKLSSKSAICVEAFRDLSYTSTLNYLGFKVIEIPITDNGLNLDVLETQLKSQNVSYILINPCNQNPTGISYSLENKLKLIELADKYDTYIIEDGTFSDFTYYSTNINTCYDLCKNDRVIYLYNFCKLYLPNLDYSFVVLPAKLQKRLIDDMNITISERFVRYYLESEYFINLRQILIKDSARKYAKLKMCLDLSTNLTNTSTSGLFFWLTPLSKEKIYNTLLEKNIVVSPSDLFSVSHIDNSFRLSIAPLSDTDIEQIIDVLENYV
ncbi:MAG: hypothetical protein BEN19_01900 [Epulopiscium sp. Nuni2H_MBin003]|nr:MAG: hypothetical protein BEN19_01900 [Epulopiscium sp. Nuni2H_MBin003]